MNVETIIETARQNPRFSWGNIRSLKCFRNIPTFPINQRLGAQFFAGTFAERIGNVETPQGTISHLGMRQDKDLAPAALPEHGGNVGGMVELRFFTQSVTNPLAIR